MEKKILLAYCQKKCSVANELANIKEDGEAEIVE
jgi:hypothetical protein